MTKKLDIDADYDQWNEAVEDLSSRIVDLVDSEGILDDFGQAEALVSALVHLTLSHHKQDAEIVLELVKEHLQEASEYLKSGSQICDALEDDSQSDTEESLDSSLDSSRPKKPLLN